MPGYGWCGYCPAFTYHDLRYGACAECWYRWGKFPATMPADIKRLLERNNNAR
jgi:hypothetical protein